MSLAWLNEIMLSFFSVVLAILSTRYEIYFYSFPYIPKVTSLVKEQSRDDASSKEETFRNMGIINGYHILTTQFISCDPLPCTLHGCSSETVEIVILA